MTLNHWITGNGKLRYTRDEHHDSALSLQRTGERDTGPRKLRRERGFKDMTPQFILRASLCRPPHCASKTDWKRHAESEIENLGWANAYAEPGYDNPRKAILFANWNYFPRDISDTLERAGYAIEWSDEWTTCGDCGNAVRTSPDSYGYQPSYVILNDCEIVCHTCLLDNDSTVRDYLESLENHSKRALNLTSLDPGKYGYREVENGFENGLHPGQNDDPKQITAKLRAQGVTSPLLFKIDGTGQFDIEFSVWTRDLESEISE